MSSLEPRAQRKPNVILLMTDQHRADALGCMGNPIIKTPHLDRLASAGVIFESAFAQCPVCMASRGAIHTGRYPRSIRMPSMGLLPPAEITMAETLKRAGYATGMFGKLHFTPQEHTRRELGSETPIIDAGVFLEKTGILSAATRAAVEDPAKRNYGFDAHVGIEDHLWGPYVEWLAERAPELVPIHCSENWSISRSGVKFNSSPPATRLYGGKGDFFDSHMPGEMHPSAFIVEKTLEFVRRCGEKPFFAHCSFVDPHHPFNAPQPFNRMYSPSDMPVPPAVQPDFLPPGLTPALRQNIAKMWTFPDELWQGGLANYYGMIQHIDWCVGRLVSGLQELGQLDNTLIVFTSDHGEYIGDHRMLHKGSVLLDSEVRVPLVFYWKEGVPEGRRIGELVQEIDIYPTVMSLLGLPNHPGVQGKDHSAALRGGPATGYQQVFCELDKLPPDSLIPSQMIRSKQWKLIYYPGCREGMLFNLKEDPGETRNLFHDPGCQRIVCELLMSLVDSLYDAKDPLPIRLGLA